MKIKRKSFLSAIVSLFLIGTMCNGVLASDVLPSLDFSSRVEETFSKETADGWDAKAKFVKYHGVKNPITDEVMMNVKGGMSILDVGCGTGKLVSKIDKKIEGGNLVGLDISGDMIKHAKSKAFTGNNKVDFIADDFMKHDFNDKFDIIIFSYVLHHMSDPAQALKYAKSLLADGGIILFSVPGSNYLSETFEPEELPSRYTLKEMDEIVNEAGLYCMTACRNDFLMTFDSYERYIDYLKSIGTYQKISGYTDKAWTDEFNKKILEKFGKTPYITGEYLTYACKDKSNILG